MRPFLVALGTIWFLLSTAVSYRVFTTSRPVRPAIIVQPGALRAPQQQAQPLPPVEPEPVAPRFAAPAVEAEVPEEPPPAFSEPEPESVVPPAEALRPRPVVPPPPVTYPAVAPVQAVRETVPADPREAVSGARETRRPRTRKSKPVPAPAAAPPV